LFWHLSERGKQDSVGKKNEVTGGVIIICEQITVIGGTGGTIRRFYLTDRKGCFRNARRERIVLSGCIGISGARGLTHHEVRGGRYREVELIRKVGCCEGSEGWEAKEKGEGNSCFWG